MYFVIQKRTNKIIIHLCYLSVIFICHLMMDKTNVTHFATYLIGMACKYQYVILTTGTL